MFAEQTRIMAIDYGEARIGIALTDQLKIISSGYKTLQNNKDILMEIFNICREKNVDSIVVGIPYNLDSEIGESAKRVLLFVKRLNNFFKENGFNVKFYEIDEGYSTINAADAMREIKVKTKKKKSVIDQIAASIILSNFLKGRNKNGLNPDEISL